MADPKIPSEGPMLAANIEKCRLAGVRQRYAISEGSLRTAPAKGAKK